MEKFNYKKWITENKHGSPLNNFISEKKYKRGHGCVEILDGEPAEDGCDATPCSDNSDCGNGCECKKLSNYISNATKKNKIKEGKSGGCGCNKNNNIKEADLGYRGWACAGVMPGGGASCYATQGGQYASQAQCEKNCAVDKGSNPNRINERPDIPKDCCEDTQGNITLASSYPTGVCPKSQIAVMCEGPRPTGGGPKHMDQFNEAKRLKEVKRVIAKMIKRTTRR